MMIEIALLMSLWLTVIGAQFFEAPVITNNTNNTYTLNLLDKNTTDIRGDVIASAGPGGVGVLFNVDFTGFPQGLGPFRYHIHTERVPEDGNCTATLGHLDPYHRLETPPCNSTEPATCQLGDLSGKHGEIVVVAGTNQTWLAEYIDYFLSTDPGSNAFFGNLSIVVHSANSTRLNCGNFELSNATEPLAAPKAGASNSTPSVFTHAVPTETAAPSSVPYDGSAGKITSQTTGGLSVILSALLLM